MNLLGVIGIILGLVFLLDLVEQIRIFSPRGVVISKIFAISFYRSFYVLLKVYGFLVLLVSIVTFQKLSKSSELIVLRASGISVWQFTKPVLISSFFFGLLVVMLLSPITATLYNESERLISSYKKENAKISTLTKTGIWVKEEADDGKMTVIHANKASLGEDELHEVTFYFLDASGRFIKRIDSKMAKLNQSVWEVANATAYDKDNNISSHAMLHIPTDISFNNIIITAASPESLPIWKLPKFIAIAEESGFSAIKYKIYFYKLLILPLFFACLALLGTSFALQSTRFRKVFKFAIVGITIGFGLYFFDFFLQALAVSGRANIIVGVLATPILTLLFGIYVHLKFEDG